MAHRGSRGITLLFHDHGTRRGEGSASRPGLSLPPGKTRYSLYRRLGGPQGWSGQVQKILPPPGFNPRTVQPVASHYTDWATWPTFTVTSKINFTGVIYTITFTFRSLNISLTRKVFNQILLLSFILPCYVSRHPPSLSHRGTVMWPHKFLIKLFSIFTVKLICFSFRYCPQPHSTPGVVTRS